MPGIGGTSGTGAGGHDEDVRPLLGHDRGQTRDDVWTCTPSAPASRSAWCARNRSTSCFEGASPATSSFPPSSPSRSQIETS